MIEIACDFAFGDGARWHEGELWFSDMHAREVLRLDVKTREKMSVCEVPGSPSGLGWLPDGRLLVVSMRDRRVLRLEPDGDLVVHADLADVAGFHCNDMVVDRAGRAYVGNFGSDHVPGRKRDLADLALVHPDGRVEVATKGLGFPNGGVITPDGSTLILAETMGRHLLAFDIDDGGRLSDRRVWADLGDGLPDGICLDAEGAVWYSDPRIRECVRVAEGGEILFRIETEYACYSCALGGETGSTLFMLTSATDDPAKALQERSGSVFAYEVDVPAAV
jgi:sugar lactone lactonase YvrE